MRVLLVHNRYRSGAPGGEDVVFEQEREMLVRAGHEVCCYTRSNDEMNDRSLADKWRVVWNMQRSRRTFLELRRLIRRVRPEVAHFHNIFPLISASGYQACAVEGVPVIQTIHNYRFSCSTAFHFRDGAVCERCTADDPWSSVRFACYRGSRAASLAVALTLYRNKISGIQNSHIAKYIALTKFAAQRLTAAGIPQERVVIRPNALDLPLVSDEVFERNDSFLFVGRLSAEKGVRFLLQAWRQLRDVPLLIVGDGPLRCELEHYARRHELPVSFLGLLDRPSLLPIFRSGRALIFPSLWFEGMPMTLLEAMASGTPVIASRIGGVPELVRPDVHGLLFDPENAAQLQACVRRLQADPVLRLALSQAALQKVREDHGLEKSLQSLLEIYSSVRGQVGKRVTS